jgi:ferredoxin like protein
MTDSTEKNNKSIQDKLATIKYNCDNKTHIALNQKKCSKCKEKVCTYICPAGVYKIDENTNEIVVQYENCLECGACRISCPKHAIDWHYPASSCGIILKNS